MHILCGSYCIRRWYSRDSGNLCPHEHGSLGKETEKSSAYNRVKEEGALKSNLQVSVSPVLFSSTLKTANDLMQ